MSEAELKLENEKLKELCRFAGVPEIFIEHPALFNPTSIAAAAELHKEIIVQKNLDLFNKLRKDENNS